MEKAATVVYLRTILLIALPLLISCQQTHIEHQDDPAHIDVDDPKWRLQLLNRFREVPPRNWPPFQRPPFPIEPPSLIEVPHNWPQQQPNAAQEERLQPQQINPETTGNSNSMGQLNEIPQPMDSRPPSPSKQEEKKPQRLEGVATSILVPLVPVHVDNFGNTVRLPFTFQLPPHQQQLRHPPLTDSRPMMPQRRIPPQVDNDNRFEEQKKVENLPNQQQQHQQQTPFKFEQNRIFAPPNQSHRFNRQENFNNHPPPLFPPFNNRPFPPHPQQDSRLFPNNFEQSNNNFQRPPLQPPPNRLPQQQQEVQQKLFQQQQQQQLQQNSEKQRFQQEQVQEGSEQQRFQQQVQQDSEQQRFQQQQVQQDSEQQRFQQQPNSDQQNFQQQVQQNGEQQNFQQQVQQNSDQQRFQHQQNSEQQNFQQQQPQQNSEQQRFQQLPQQDGQKKHFQQQLQQNGEQQRFQRQQQDNERQRFQRPQQDNERQRFQQQENERQRFQQQDSERENMQRQQLQQDGEQQRLQQQMQPGSEQRFRQNNIRQQRLQQQFQPPNNINNEGPNFDRNPNLIQSESAPPDWNQFHKNQSPLPEITNSLPPLMPNQQQQIPSHPPFGFHPPPRFPFPPRPPQEMMPPRPPHEMMPPRPPPHEMMPPRPPPHEMMPPQQMMPPPHQMPPPLPTRDVEVPKIFGDFPSEPKFDRSPWIPITPLPKVPHTPIVSPSREALRVEQPPPGPLSTTPSSQSIDVSVGKDFDVLSTTTSAQQENQEPFQAPNMIASSTSAPMALSSQPSITIDQRNFIENPSNQAIEQGQNFIRMDFERETVSINQTDFGSIQQPDNSNTSMLDDQPNKVRHLQPPEQFYPVEEIESSTAVHSTPPIDQQQNRLESTPWTDNNVIVTSPPSLIEPLDNPTPQQPLEMSPELRQISVDQLYKHWKMQFGQGRDNNVEMPSTSSTTEAINHVISGPLNDQLSSFDIRQIDWSRRTTPAFTPSPDPRPMTPLPQIQQPEVEANTGFALTLSNRNRRRPTEETTTEHVTEGPSSESFITPSVILQDKEHSTKTPDDVTKRTTGEMRKVIVRRRKVLRKKVSKTTSPSTDLVNEYTHSSSDITTSP